MEFDRDLATRSLNNYVYYLSARNTVEDKMKVASVLDKFKEMIGKEENAENPLCFEYKATLGLAQLYLEFITPHEAQENLQNLLDSSELGTEGKKRICEDIERYNRVNELVDDAGFILKGGIILRTGKRGHEEGYDFE